jgi:hypothetical protein
MRGKFLIPAALAVLSAAGCTVGNGSGTANGMLWILGCREGADLGTPAAPEEWSLDPTFFAGEPIEDIADGPPENRLTIRMQRNGNAVEINDTLYFDIADSAQIAQCLRGQTVGGIPQWDTSGTGSVDPDVMGPWCQPAAMAGGLARIHLFPYGPVNVSLAPLASCHSANKPPSLVNVTGVAFDGWIEFLDFGRALQTDLAPDARTSVESDFKVSYGERLRANFEITVLGDLRVATAERIGQFLPPAPAIGGTLMGNFDFDLERGRSVQTFP